MAGEAFSVQLPIDLKFRIRFRLLKMETLSRVAITPHTQESYCYFGLDAATVLQ